LPNNGPALRHTLTTPRLDLTQTPDPVLRFRYAFAKRDTANSDQLVVKMSRDCGVQWIVRRTITAAEIATVDGAVAVNFVPGEGDWTEVLVSNIPVSYQTNNVIFQFEFTSGGGNDLYLDDINIVDVDALNVPDRVAESWSIHPNPATDNFRIEGHFNQQHVELFTLEGRLALNLGLVGSNTNVAVNELPAGIYLVRLSSGASTTMRRLMVAR